MKTKLMAGVVASLISLVVLVGLAILMVAVFNTEPSDGMTKIAAFLIIGIWIGLYSWLKPKGQPGILEKNQQEISERDQQKKESEKVEEKKSERNSYQ